MDVVMVNISELLDRLWSDFGLWSVCGSSLDLLWSVFDQYCRVVE